MITSLSISNRSRSVKATSQTSHLSHQGGHFGQSGCGGGGDPRVHVVWARFEVADVNDPKLFPEGAEVNGNSPPLLLVLGYTQGVQGRKTLKELEMHFSP